MVFSSTIFLFVFFPIILFGYYLIKEQYRNYWLLFASLIFFAWSQPNYLWIILLNVLINYCGAMLIDDLKILRKYVLAITIILNLGILYYFKYFDFTVDSINKLLGCNVALRNIILPIGISFFTFQGMSYVIDVYKGDVPVQKNVFKLALYIVLFPQLIAGPIVRYKDIVMEIDRRSVILNDFAEGIERFIIGIVKKAILANTLASTVDMIWKQGTANITWDIAWVGSIAYTLQIYFDFSGYSDMAIGLGRIFGFHFNENFNLPYISKSISEFWRRWHISLSAWFRDYVYIPLGGNRKKVYINLAIVFLLTGIWHGASWHFLIWGAWNGLFVLMERFIQTKRISKERDGGVRLRIVLSKVYTLFVVNLGWVLFRAPHTRNAIQFIMVMFGMRQSTKVGYTVFWYLDNWTVTIMILSIFFSSSIPLKINKSLKKCKQKKLMETIKCFLLLGLFYISLLRIVSGTYNPFIYFQF